MNVGLDPGKDTSPDWKVQACVEIGGCEGHLLRLELTSNRLMPAELRVDLHMGIALSQLWYSPPWELLALGVPAR